MDTTWHGNFVSLPVDPIYGVPIVKEEPHLLNCTPKDRCNCICKDCVSDGECRCPKCICNDPT
jgi:hypothetical protein